MQSASRTGIAVSIALIVLTACGTTPAPQPDLWQAIPIEAAQEANPIGSVQELVERSDLVVVGSVVGFRIEQVGVVDRKAGPNDSNTMLQFLVVEIQPRGQGSGDIVQLVFYNYYLQDYPSMKITRDTVQVPSGEAVFALLDRADEDPEDKARRYVCTGLAHYCPLGLNTAGTWTAPRDPEANEWMTALELAPGQEGDVTALFAYAQSVGTPTLGDPLPAEQASP